LQRRQKWLSSLSDWTLVRRLFGRFAERDVWRRHDGSDRNDVVRRAGNERWESDGHLQSKGELRKIQFNIKY